MNRWFRHYVGMMRDEKLVRVAVQSKQPVERVLWVWGAILESAAEVNDGGRFECDAGEAGYFLRCDESDIARILSGLESVGRIAQGVVVRWSDRQFESDTSRERQRRYRERNKHKAGVRDGDDHGDAGDVTVTSPDGEVTPQENIEQITELEPNGSLSETSSDAPQRPQKKRAEYPATFEAVWRDYPTDANMSKKEAFDAFKRLDQADVAVLTASIPAFKAYCRANPDYRPIHLCRFIKFRRFEGFAQTATVTEAGADIWQKRLAYARQKQTWSTAEWGPRPGTAGCLVPKNLLLPDDGTGWTEWSKEAA